MTNTIISDTTEPPARWASTALDAWRELAAERAEHAEALRDRDAYRELAQLAIHALADLTERHRRQTERYHALLNAHRRDTRREAA